MENKRTIVLVLRSGGDFSFRDVELIARHINGKWESETRPRIICLWDKASAEYDMGNIEFIPLTNDLPGTWSRMQLYSPEMEQYRPFLYVDLDTAVIQSLEKIFDLVPDPSWFITLEDFWQKRKMATGLVWFPANSRKISAVWNAWKADPKVTGFRMDDFLRKVVEPDVFWQRLTTTIYDFKPVDKKLLSEVPQDATVVCFHGKPRIYDVVGASISLPWVKNYVREDIAVMSKVKSFTQKKVTVIIPYNKDRGWLKDAIVSVPDGVQLILSKGDGNWPQNFNKGLQQATGDYIRWLHEDDMLTPNCIADSVKAIDDQKVDFIHGNTIELWQGSGGKKNWRPLIKNPTLRDLIYRNTIHSASLMYKRAVFEKVGGLDESTSINSFEEYEFNLRCLAAGLRLGYCSKPLAIYRRHPSQLIRNVPRGGRMREREVLKNKYRAYA